MNTWYARVALAVAILGLGPSSSRAEDPRIVLAADGKAMLPVVIAEQASARVEKAAQTLGEYLGKISGGSFEVVRGDGQSGLAVGLASDFPAVKTGVEFAPQEIPRREEYLLRSHRRGLYLLGATELAVEDAVWGLLHLLGYRQYFPGEAWEHVPSTPDLAISLDVVEKPAFFYRRIWYGFGIWPDNAQSEADWKARNRMVAAFNLAHSHAYDGLYGQRKAVFDAHPEYFALVNGKREARGGQKFCLANPAARKVILDWALDQFVARPQTECISLDPSDGGGWCLCDVWVMVGCVSDRVFGLANEAVAAINDRFAAQHGTKYVGINIYHQHSAPPTVRVDPRIIGLSTTAFISGDFTHDQIVRGWQKQGATVGVYDYFSVLQWDWDMPGAPGASCPEAVAKNLAHYYDLGARLLSAESSDNWGPSGLGYYVASRVLWNPAEAGNVEAIRQEFLTNCFGPAKPQMEKFYRTIDGAYRPMLSEHLLGRMYRQLDEARRATADPKVLARINQLVLYTREQELHQAWRTAKDPVKRTLGEQMLRFMYRMHKTRMAHTFAMSIAVTGQMKDLPDSWNVHRSPEGKCPWKETTPFTEAEIADILRDGIAHNATVDFEPVRFSDDLVPARPLHLPDVPTTDLGDGQGNIVVFEHLFLYTWVDKPPAAIPFRLTGRWFYDYKYNAVVKVSAAEDPTGQPFINDNTTPCDKQPHEWVLKTNFRGLHRVWLVKGYHGGCRIEWPEGTPMTLVTSTAKKSPIYGYGTAYFYVPKGTRTLGGYIVRAEGEICDPDGKVVAALRDLAPKKTGYFALPVPPGQDGKLWKLNRSAHFVVLLTVPSCLARNDRELLLPREVVEADAAAAK